MFEVSFAELIISGVIICFVFLVILIVFYNRKIDDEKHKKTITVALSVVWFFMMFALFTTHSETVRGWLDVIF